MLISFSTQARCPVAAILRPTFRVVKTHWDGGLDERADICTWDWRRRHNLANPGDRGMVPIDGLVSSGVAGSRLG
jgi:hypothetical protein